MEKRVSARKCGARCLLDRVRLGEMMFAYFPSLLLWASVPTAARPYRGLLSSPRGASLRPWAISLWISEPLPRGVTSRSRLFISVGDNTPQGERSYAHGLMSRSTRRPAGTGRRGPGRRFAPWSIGNWSSGLAGGIESREVDRNLRIFHCSTVQCSIALGRDAPLFSTHPRSSVHVPLSESSSAHVRSSAKADKQCTRDQES